jgi:hypothetical protein
MLKSVSQHVVLEVVAGMNGGCGPGKLDFVRVLADGNSQSRPGGLGWRVPAGQALVVADVDWQYIPSPRSCGGGSDPSAAAVRRKPCYPHSYPASV